MLLNLPAELLLAILAQVEDQRTLKNLCEVCHELYDLAIPLLYESITLDAKNEYRLGDLAQLPLLLEYTCESQKNLLRHVKDVEIFSSFHDMVEHRCIHNRASDFFDSASDIEDEDEEIGDEHFDGGVDDGWSDWGAQFARLTRGVTRFLKQCDEGSLRSFTWGLGTCIPLPILDSSGYLPQKQTNLESIQLITGAGCKENVEGMTKIDLSVFKKLKSLSWIGLRSQNDFDALRDAISHIAGHLTEFELDAGSWKRGEDALWLDGPDNFFAWETLGLVTKQPRQIFNNLQTLSLTGFSFHKASKEMAYAFNFTSLRALRVRFCRDWEQFLDQGMMMDSPLNLTSLELQSTIEYEDFCNEEVIHEFLSSFEGLEHLAISTGDSTEVLDVWRSLDRHKSTLRAFVHHHRRINIDDESKYFEEECDNSDLTLSIYQKELKEWKRDPSQHPFNELELEFLGLGCHPKYMMQVLLPLATNTFLRIVHIRQSGSDLKHYADYAFRYIDGDEGSQTDEDSSQDETSPEPNASRGKGPLFDLAQWAFGANGLHRLQIVAYGDFSHDQRYGKNNIILCRNFTEQHDLETEGACTYRHITKDDHSLWDVLTKYWEMLEACPADPLFED